MLCSAVMSHTCHKSIQACRAGNECEKMWNVKHIKKMDVAALL